MVACFYVSTIISPPSSLVYYSFVLACLVLDKMTPKNLFVAAEVLFAIIERSKIPTLHSQFAPR